MIVFFASVLFGAGKLLLVLITAFDEFMRRIGVEMIAVKNMIDLLYTV